jgi:hypothetical protein
MYTKKLKLGLMAGLLFAGILNISFSRMAGGSVRGTVTPPEAGLKAFLFSTKDTLSANVVNGAFQFFNVATGNYKLMVEAAPPYRNGIKDGVSVTDGQFTDAGQIELQK